MLSNHVLLFVVLPIGCYKKFNYNVYNRYFFTDNSYVIKSWIVICCITPWVL